MPTELPSHSAQPPVPVPPAAGVEPEEDLDLNVSAGELWRARWLAWVAVAAVFFGAARETWSQGLAAGLIGLSLLAAPPRQRLPAVPALALAAFMLAPLLGLLPAAWLGTVDPWQTLLAESWQLPVAGTLSPDARATTESWLVVVAGGLWFWACLGQRFSPQGRRVCLRWLALGGAGIAIATLLEYAGKVEIPWWPRDAAWGEGYGPFANRNHVSSLSASACVLAAASAYDAYRRGSRSWLLLALLTFAPIGAIVANTSRAGLLLLLLGMTLWLCTAAMRRGLIRKLVVVSAIIMAVVSVISVSGGRLGERVKAEVAAEAAAPAGSLRVDLARDVLRLSVDRPWVGRGFDTFGTVFPLVTDLHSPNYRFLHPESDVLLLLFEGGLLALLPCAVLVVWLLRSTGPWRSGSRRQAQPGRSGRRLRLAAAIAAGLGVAHACFDVPNHGLAYLMGGALLWSLAVRPRRLPAGAGRGQVWLFRGLGLAILALGVGWGAIARGLWLPPAASTVPVLNARALQETANGDHAAALASVEQALIAAPLDFRLYYLRAQLRLQLRQSAERALLDFGRARTLEPHNAALCLEEGLYWLGFAPELAVIPWRECLRRDPAGAESIYGRYKRMLDAAGHIPELRQPLWRLAERPSLQLLFLGQARPGEEWQRCFADFMEQHPHWEDLDAGYQRALLKAWQERGDRPQLMQLLQAKPALTAFAWRVVAEERARSGDYQQAYETAARHLKPPRRSAVPRPADLPRLERSFVLNPTDLRLGLELSDVQRLVGDLRGARLTLERLMHLPGAPKYLVLEVAAIYGEMQDYRRAWEIMQDAMQLFPEE